MRTRSLSLLAAGSLTALACLPAASFAQEGGEDIGSTIQVGPDGGVDVRVDGEAEPRGRLRLQRRLNRPGFVEAAPVAVSRYWIGLGGIPVAPEIRAQLDLAPGEGLLVRTLAEEGPAAKAGVQKFDILLRANDKPLAQVAELADMVGEQGEAKGRITLELLRRGKPVTVAVTPAERPVDAAAPAAPRRRLGERFGGGRFGGEGLGGRLFGPGGVIEEGGLEGLLGEGFGGEAFGGFAEMMPQMAGQGVAVSVQQTGNGPAKVTVKKGEQTWEFNEGDAAAMAALPADVRPMVERMLRGRAAGQDFNGLGFGGPGFQMQFGGDMAEQMQQLQEMMRQRMQNRLGGAAPQQQVPQPRLDLDEAPAFNGGGVPEIAPEPQEEEGPVEIEIPAGT